MIIRSLICCLVFSLFTQSIQGQDQKQTKAKARIDPVATGLRSHGGNAVPIVTASLRSLAINDKGTLLAIGTGEGEILIWDTVAEKLVRRWKGHEKWVFDLSFDSNSGTLISGGGDSYTKIWSVSDWKPTTQLRDHDDDVHGVAVTPDSKKLVTGGDDTFVMVRNIESEKVSKLEGHTAQVTSVVLDNSGRRAFSGSRDGTIRVWDVETKKEIATLSGHTEDVLHVATDRSDQFLASASYDGTVRIWSLESLKAVNVFKVPDVWMLSVEFSADSQTVFAGSTDFHVRAFDRQSGKEIWKSHTVSDPSDLVLSPSGKRLYASSAANGIFVYDVSNQKGVVSKKIPIMQTQAPRVATLTTQEYLKMHESLMYAQQKEDWAAKVGLLSIHGDRFTDHLLQKIDVSKLPAPKRELAYRLQNRSRAKYEPFAGTPISARELSHFWGKYAAAEYLELKVSESLEKWLFNETQRTNASLKGATVDKSLIEQSVRMQIRELSQSDEDTAKAKRIQKDVLQEFQRIGSAESIGNKK